jgi:hypothetical protein
MDPKMDSGCEAHMSNFEEQYDVQRPLLPEEVLGLMDQLLCLEVPRPPLALWRLQPRS